MLENASTKTAAAKPTAKATATETTAKTAGRTTAGRAGALKPATRKNGGKGLDLQAQIRQRAYELWERDGRPEGRDHAHWQQAEREIGAAHAAD